MDSQNHHDFTGKFLDLKFPFSKNETNLPVCQTEFGELYV